MKKIAYIFIGIFILGMFAMVPRAIAQEEIPAFRRGMWGGGPVTLDAHNCWDSASADVITQVQEGLVKYDLYDPSMAIVPSLATDLGTWSEDGLEITFNLRQGVTWHDGTPFNASCVKFSFDRLNHLIVTEESILGELYEPLLQLHPDTPLVINETVVVSDYVVKFVLNYKYVAFLALLCFSGSFIVHMSSPLDAEFELASEYLIGTGAYVLQGFEPTEYTFVAYEDYYLPQPEIQQMSWIMFDDMQAESQAFLSGDIDQPSSTDPDFLTQYEEAEEIYVDPPMRTTVIQYLGMNMEAINLTWRRAISYAIDYDYIIQYIMNNQAIRMTSVVPYGILYHDPTVTPLPYNLDEARKVLSAANVTRGLTYRSADLLWVNIAESGDPLNTFNFTYNQGNNRRGDIGLLVKTNLKLIGCKVDIFVYDWTLYNDIMNYHPEQLSIFNIGWMADYNDPSNYINPLLSNTSLSNAAQVNDPQLQDDMMSALADFDPVSREAKYKAMQHYIVEDLVPWVFMYTGYAKAAWSIHLTHFPRNPQGTLYYYPSYWYHVYTTPTPPAIPGYSFLALLGVAAVTIGVLLYKRRR
jgi:peptide/nickel transport system substrate-binding protein